MSRGRTGSGGPVEGYKMDVLVKPPDSVSKLDGYDELPKIWQLVTAINMEGSEAADAESELRKNALLVTLFIPLSQTISSNAYAPVFIEYKQVYMLKEDLSKGLFGGFSRELYLDSVNDCPQDSVPVETYNALFPLGSGPAI